MSEKEFCILFICNADTTGMKTVSKSVYLVRRQSCHNMIYCMRCIFLNEELKAVHSTYISQFIIFKTVMQFTVLCFIVPVNVIYNLQSYLSNSISDQPSCFFLSRMVNRPSLLKIFLGFRETFSGRLNVPVGSGLAILLRKLPAEVFVIRWQHFVGLSYC